MTIPRFLSAGLMVMWGSLRLFRVLVSLFSWLRFVGLARAFLSSWSMVILVLSMKFSSGFKLVICWNSGVVLALFLRNFILLNRKSRSGSTGVLRMLCLSEVAMFLREVVKVLWCLRDVAMSLGLNVWVGEKERPLFNIWSWLWDKCLVLKLCTCTLDDFPW